MSDSEKVKIPIFTHNPYRVFCSSWWKHWFEQLTTGWWRDLRAFWHRGRYGWEPRDTWGLDNYYDGVMGGSLMYLSEHHCGAPFGYPNLHPESMEAGTDFDKWKADLKRWAQTFLDNARDDYYEIHGNNYEAWNADERRRYEARNAVLQEMVPWWGGLWD